MAITKTSLVGKLTIPIQGGFSGNTTRTLTIDGPVTGSQEAVTRINTALRALETRLTQDPVSTPDSLKVFFQPSGWRDNMADDTDDVYTYNAELGLQYRIVTTNELIFEKSDYDT